MTRGSRRSACPTASTSSGRQTGTFPDFLGSSRETRYWHEVILTPTEVAQSSWRDQFEQSTKPHVLPSETAAFSRVALLEVFVPPRHLSNRVAVGHTPNAPFAQQPATSVTKSGRSATSSFRDGPASRYMSGGPRLPPAACRTSCARARQCPPRHLPPCLR